MADVLGFLKKGFPFISTALSLGGPAGNLAAAALGKVLAIDKPTPENVIKAIGTSISPEQLESFKQAEAELAAQMKLAGFEHAEDMESLASADRADARQREIKTGDRITPRVLAAVVVAGWSVIQLYLIPQAIHATHVPDPSMIGMLNRVLGTLDGALMLVLAYYFGSSAGSAAKSDLLAQK
jgi:hypothetical protein